MDGRTDGWVSGWMSESDWLDGYVLIGMWVNGYVGGCMGE